MASQATLNESIVEAINHASVPWGLQCLRCEIRDIALPDKVVEDMQRQVSAERRKRASILESEGEREAAINRQAACRHFGACYAHFVSTSPRLNVSMSLRL